MKSLSQYGVLVVVLAGFAFASSPEDALLYRNPDLVRAEEDLRRANEELGFLSYVDAGIVVKPSATLTDRLDDDERATFVPRLSSTLSLEYRYSDRSVLQNQRGVLAAQLNLIKLERDGVVQALTAHTELLRAQLSARAAENALVAAQENVAEAEAAFEAGTQTRNQLNEVTVSLERAELAFEQAQGRLEDALAEAADYGLGTPATFSFFQFELPQVVLSDLLALQDQQLSLEQTRLDLDNLYFLGTVSEVALSVGYSGNSVGAEAAVGIFESVPGANLELDAPGSANPTFRFGLAAEIGFDLDRITEIADAERNLQRAEEDYAEFAATLEADLSSAYEAALFAEEDVRLALEDYDLDGRIVADAEQLVADLTAALEGAEDQDKAEKNLETATNNLEKAKASLVRSEDGVYQKWLTYVQRVRDYLAKAEATFVVSEVQ
jgi:outer membrane protein TolC